MCQVMTSEDIQAQCNVLAPRKMLLNGQLVQPGQGYNPHGIEYTTHQAIIAQQPEKSRVHIQVRDIITDYTNRLAPQEAWDLSSGRVKFFSDLMLPVSKSDSLEYQRTAGGEYVIYTHTLRNLHNGISRESAPQIGK